MNEQKIEKILKIIPASLSWSIIVGLILLIIFRPLWAAIFLIIYLLYWFFRLLYMSLLLIMAHHRMSLKRKINWLNLCKNLNTDFRNIWHIVLYTTYKEPIQLLRESLTALKNVDYPLDRIIVVLAGEEREIGIVEKLTKLKDEFKECFNDLLITIHPKDIPGEIQAKGSNATYASKIVKDYLEQKGIRLEDVLISCFDADTCPDPQYFSCLTYHFLTNPKRYQLSFQPLPIYNNNIYYAPSFARIIEIGSTFWQLIDSIRHEKFVTFSSHSMSFKTLVDVGYWPTDMISDDSLIYWKCFVKFNGDYKTFPLDIPVYMDIAVGKNFFETLLVQYKQKRRWAWGVEAFVFLGKNFLYNDKISLGLKLRKLYQILDNHINWATWSIIINFLVPFVLVWTQINQNNDLIFYNLFYINSTILRILTFMLLIGIIISKEFIPPRPKDVSRLVYLSFILQWFLVPLVSAILGSLPALDAQTQLMFGKKFVFYPTPKNRDLLKQNPVNVAPRLIKNFFRSLL